MPAHPIDLAHQRFGKLLVLELHPLRTTYRNARWLCRCDCGATTVVPANDLRSGHTTTCGCSRAEVARAMGRATRRHGQGWPRTPEYRAWDSMRDRCRNQRHHAYASYGGRGITVCPEWRGSFERFYADMGPKPSPRHSLDRIDNDGPYSPENCRWATSGEQNRNTRFNRPLTHEGRTMPLAAWAREAGIHAATITGRLRRGWPLSKALTTAQS